MLGMHVRRQMQYAEAYGALEAALLRNPAYAPLAQARGGGGAAAAAAGVEPLLAQNRFLAVTKLHGPVLDLYMAAVAVRAFLPAAGMP